MASLLPLRQGEKRVGPARRRRVVRGLSVLELLVAITSLSVVMVGVAGLLNASWQSYQNLVWQNKANMEARRALDDICDSVRMGGSNADMNLFQQPNSPQIMIPGLYNTSDVVGVQMHGSNLMGAHTYQYGPNSDANGNGVLEYVKDINDQKEMAQYLDSVQFEYEYRTPTDQSPNTPPQWDLQRAADLNALDPTNHTYFYLVKTVYVTVNIKIPASVTGTKEYTRTLTSAVALRSPYDNTTPQAVKGQPSG